MSFFRSAFQSTLLKHAGDVCSVLRNADFFKFKKRLGTLLRKGFAHKSSTQRTNNASWLISYFDVLLWALRPFCVSQPTCGVAKILSVAAKTEIWNSCEHQFKVKIWKL